MKWFGAGVLFVSTMLAIAAYAAYEALEAPRNQFWGPTMAAGLPGRHVVALTFDDGPNPPYTDRILDVLARERVHATFFVVGRAVAAHPATVARIAREGHALGNHTWDHAHLVVESRGAIRSELYRTDDAIFRAAGVRPRLMRPPYGARDFRVINEAQREGYTVVMWSEPLPNDWDQPGVDKIVSSVLGRVRDGSIVVLHDGNLGLTCHASDGCIRAQEIAATSAIVEALRARGYRFVTIPEMLAGNARLRVTRTDGRASR